MSNSILDKIGDIKAQNTKALAVLIDPDTSSDNIKEVCSLCNKLAVDFIFCGGSLVTQGQADVCIQLIKNETAIPVLIFPGNEMHVSNKADGILFLSLVSGRNAEYLIGKQVVSAPFLKKSGLEILPTGYILVDGGRTTTVNYVSQTIPIPSNKPEIAAATAMASEMLGQQLVYLDAGSGAMATVPVPMISKVAKSIEVPIIVGGGIDTPEKAFKLYDAGASVVVIGNALEKKPGLLNELIAARDSFRVNTKSL